MYAQVSDYTLISEPLHGGIFMSTKVILLLLHFLLLLLIIIFPDSSMFRLERLHSRCYGHG